LAAAPPIPILLLKVVQKEAAEKVSRRKIIRRSRQTPFFFFQLVSLFFVGKIEWKERVAVETVETVEMCG
jgi:hypothetical protein